MSRSQLHASGEVRGGLHRSRSAPGIKVGVVEDPIRLLDLKELLAGEGAPREAAEDGEGAEEYPAWRRGARLSFALADVVSQVYGDGACSVAEWTGGDTMAAPVAEVLQELLEAPSTTDRLRLVLRRMQEARRALSG